MKVTLLRLNIHLIVGLLAMFGLTTIKAGIPVWTFTPLTSTIWSLLPTETATVQYLVTNESKKTHTLTLQPIPAITQLTAGLNICGNPFVLTEGASCILSLQVNGSQLTAPILEGPVVCELGSLLQCYRPGLNDILSIYPVAPTPPAPPIPQVTTITVTGSPLTLVTNGPNGTLIINNTSLTVPALNVTSNFTGTALEGNVTETGNTCGLVAPQSSCTLTFTPGNTFVPLTNFPIQGSNTNVVTAAISISSMTLSGVNPISGPASGGTGVILTGTGLTGTTSVTFGGVPATSINVVNSTTVTAVTPAHAVGIVDVVITGSGGAATCTNCFTYLPTTIGQSAFGGKIACLNGGLNNLIASTADNSNGIEWGGQGITVGPSAQSNVDGATNTTAIVACLTNGTGCSGGGGIAINTYAAGICRSYEVDSQGNTPCQAGNVCYHDWFLPADDNTTVSGQLNCLYLNRVAIGGFDLSSFYWSSTESTFFSNLRATSQRFSDGGEFDSNKNLIQRVRCVRAFIP